MAKRTSRSEPAAAAETEARDNAVDSKLVAYAEALGSSIGRLRNQMDSWNSQRKELVEHLSSMVGEAQSLLAELGHKATSGAGRLRRRKRKYVRPDSNPAGALKAEKRQRGVTAAQQRAMSAEPKKRGPIKGKRMEK